ncbi:hypothetical protein K1T71_006011 [Dendrolimus kikuchii]|uniref:Uncharacterized protein n=1 Tax=Dendrolimus kikuchii TaxID=765133 RepID=A0ACC1D2S7_9NEOP|nr:hypothetical protein K1T71_006011 [Dendrolimus kikuchii]
MEKYLKPDRLDIDPSSSSASKEWEHWKRTFENFLKASESTSGQVPRCNLDLLINHVSSNIYTYIAECTDYSQAMNILSKLFTKPKNIVYARFALATRKQQCEESLDTFLQILKQLSKDCDFKSVDANTNRDDYIRDAFISGIRCAKIRQRLLENLSLTLDEAYDKALSLEMAEMNCQGYNSSNLNAVPDTPGTTDSNISQNTLAATPINFSRKKSCFFCGDKIHPRRNCPAKDIILQSFEELKSDIAKSSIYAINNDIPFVVETDASEHSIAATLSQNNRPIAFFSRSLNHSEQNHSAIEKEAYAIVESLKKWRHFLIGRYFKLITDQRSVSFMFDNKKTSKVKNEKIQRWRLELAPFKYDIVYRPGKENNVADALSRVCANMQTRNERLKSLHESLCHPGVTRMIHWLRSKNFAYSIDEVRSMTNSCRHCAEIKPRFIKSSNPGPHIIKATSPFERLSVDFKGPLPSNTKNKYILTVIDEFSRFPFAFACHDMTSNTVIKHLDELFMLFGMPAYMHSDRGTCFLSNEIKEFLFNRGIATSRTTSYNPQDYSYVRMPDGRETTVSNRHLAPSGAYDEGINNFLPTNTDFSNVDETSPEVPPFDSDAINTAERGLDLPEVETSTTDLQILGPQNQNSSGPLRRTSRERRPPTEVGNLWK